MTDTELRRTPRSAFSPRAGLQPAERSEPEGPRDGETEKAHRP